MDIASTTAFIGVTFANLHSSIRSLVWSLVWSLGAARGAADAACQLDKGLGTVIDINNVAIIGNLEPRRGLLLPHMVQHHRIVENDLDGGVHFLDLDRYRHRRRRGRKIIVHIHGVFAGQDAPDAGGLLTDRAQDLAAVYRDRIVEATAV